MVTIGEKIAAFRRSRKMTQEELADVVGVSAQTVSKWETGVTMPDVTLLPALAGAFDVTVNDLFSALGEDRLESIDPDKASENAYRALFTVLQQGLRACESASLPKEDVAKALDAVRNTPGGQSALVSYADGKMSGSLYANAAVGVSYLKDESEALSLLDDENAAAILAVLSDGAARKALKVLLTCDDAAVTAAAVSRKCGIGTEEAEAALRKLDSLHMARSFSADVGESGPIRLYKLYGKHKMFLAIYPLIELARTLSEWRESWFGFRC